MECILFRHGIAAERDAWDGPDAQRPLTDKGAERVAEAAEGLRSLAAVPTHLLSSPLIRALETAKIIRDRLPKRPEIRVCDELLPDAPPDKLFPVLASLPEDARVVCVGHEPHLGRTAGVMLAGQPAPGLTLKKAGACCIRFDEAPGGRQGVLRWWLTPWQLRHWGKR